MSAKPNGLMVVDLAVPERISRWSPEQRAARAQRCRAVRWLYENALVDQRTIQRATGGRHNATQDLAAAGGSARSWWTTRDAENTQRWLDGEHYRPGVTPAWGGRGKTDKPWPSDVRMPRAPRPNRAAIARWLYENGCESWRAITGATGLRADNSAPMASRPRGRSTWSLAALDGIHPDQVSPPLAVRPATPPVVRMRGVGTNPSDVQPPKPPRIPRFEIAVWLYLNGFETQPDLRRMLRFNDWWSDLPARRGGAWSYVDLDRFLPDQTARRKGTRRRTAARERDPLLSAYISLLISKAAASPTPDPDLLDRIERALGGLS